MDEEFDYVVVMDAREFKARNGDVGGSPDVDLLSVIAVLLALMFGFRLVDAWFYSKDQPRFW